MHNTHTHTRTFHTQFHSASLEVSPRALVSSRLTAPLSFASVRTCSTRHRVRSGVSFKAAASCLCVCVCSTINLLKKSIPPPRPESPLQTRSLNVGGATQPPDIQIEGPKKGGQGKPNHSTAGLVHTHRRRSSFNGKTYSCTRTHAQTHTHTHTLLPLLRSSTDPLPTPPPPTMRTHKRLSSPPPPLPSRIVHPAYPHPRPVSSEENPTPTETSELTPMHTFRAPLTHTHTHTAHPFLSHTHSTPSFHFIFKRISSSPPLPTHTHTHAKRASPPFHTQQKNTKSELPIGTISIGLLITHTAALNYKKQQTNKQTKTNKSSK